MIAIGKMWKAVKGREADAGPPGPQSTIPRDLASLKLAPIDEHWDDDLEPSETRTAPRFVPLRTSTSLNTSAGRRVAARIINLSRTGVAVEADLRDLGPEDIVMVGTRPVSAGRRIALGAVFQFKKPLDPRLCDPSIVL